MLQLAERKLCQRLLASSFIATLLFMQCALFGAEPDRYFGIHVIDVKTGRGVPLVELKSVSNIRYVTDSAGWAAIYEPAFEHHTIFFSIKSHGYEYPADGFGNRGVRLDVAAGKTAEIKINRVNIAERLYRITGEGIYRDSVLLGKPVPIEQPVLNAQVTGQDSDQPIIYKGKARFFWGDTNRQAYPLGHFGMAGAIADLPASGGLDPSVGINLHYFTDKDGFSRPTITDPPNHLRWADGLTVLRDSAGVDKLVARVQVKASLAKTLEVRLLIWNDKAEHFDTLKRIDNRQFAGADRGTAFPYALGASTPSITAGHFRTSASARRSRRLSGPEFIRRFHLPEARNEIRRR